MPFPSCTGLLAVLTTPALTSTLARVRDILAGPVAVTFAVEGVSAKAPALNDAAGRAGHSLSGMDMD